MILSFRHFDPLQDGPPNTFQEEGGDIIFRAKRLLEGRTKLELEDVAKILNWMLDESPAHQELFEEMAAEAKSLENGQNISKVSARRNFHSPSYNLMRCRGKFDLVDHPDLRNMAWSDLFAVLALALIGQACEDEQYYESWAKPEDGSDWLHEWRIHIHASAWLLDAMDAVATAEGLRLVEAEFVENQKKVSLRNRQAAIQRHSKTNDALLEFEKFYLEGKHHSMRNAAQKFTERFPDLVSHLAHYNRVRTLSEGLSKLLKDQRPSLQNKHPAK